MRREDIANFLTAERKVSPLMAFSLLITAGFIAGSLQLVAPVPTEQHTMMAMVPEGTENSTKDLETAAPKSCTEAIQQALGKDKGPKATTVSQGDSNSADSCFGGVLADSVHGTPSQNKADYKCVGRSGRVTFTPGSSVTTTEPDKDVAMGKCKIQVCQPKTTVVNGKTEVDPNCGPPTQYGGGQTVSPKTGGVPSMPQFPQFPSGGGGSGGGSTAPAPNTTQPPITSKPSTDGMDALEGSKAQEDAAQRVKELGGQCYDGDTTCEPKETDAKTGGAKEATVPGGDTAEITPECVSNESCPGNEPKEKADTNVKLPVTFSEGGTTLTDKKDSDETKTEPEQRSSAQAARDLLSAGWEKIKSGWNWLTGAGSSETSGASPTETVEDGTLQRRSPITPGTDQPGVADFCANNPGSCVSSEDGTLQRRSPITPGTDQPGVADFCANNPGSCVNSNGQPMVTSLYPGTDQPGVAEFCKANPGACIDSNGKVIEPGVYPGSDQPGVADFCKKNPSACVQTGVVNPPPGQQVPPPSTTIPPDCNPPKPGCPGYQAPPAAQVSYAPPAPQQKSWFDQLKDRITSPSGLSSLLSGMMKGGLGGGGGSSTGGTNAQTSGPCPTDPAAYARYQQQYNYYLQQYNYDLQQYNYRAQQNSNYGYSTYAAPPVPPQPCNPNGNTVNQCTSLGAQPDPSSCPVGTWRQMTNAQSGSVCPVWQCVAANDSTPTAQITCKPSVAEKGSIVSVAYTCSNAKSSSGHGFETNGMTAGSANVTVDPPGDASGMNLAITCANGNVTASAQCTVQIAKISMVLRAEPKQTRVGSSAIIGWMTTGMKSCSIASPNDAGFSDRNHGSAPLSGIATTSPIDADSEYTLTCITVTGQVKSDTVTVEAYRPGTVSTLLGGKTNVQRGSQTTITWNFPDAPDVSAVALWLYSVEDKQSVALITGHRAKSGTYTWDLPDANDPCNAASSLVCGSDLVPGRTYKILASLYTPPNATLGEFPDQHLPEPKYLDGPLSAEFKVQQ